MRPSPFSLLFLLPPPLPLLPPSISALNARRLRYLDKLDTLNLACDVAVLITHCPVRSCKCSRSLCVF